MTNGNGFNYSNTLPLYCTYSPLAENQCIYIRLNTGKRLVNSVKNSLCGIFLGKYFPVFYPEIPIINLYYKLLQFKRPFILNVVLSV